MGGSEAREEARADAAPFRSEASLVLVVGPDGHLRHASAGWTEIFGEPEDAGRGLGVLEALHPERLEAADAEALRTGLDAALHGAASATVPLVWKDPERGRRVLEGRAYGPRKPSGNRVIVFHDVTARTAALEALRESESRFRVIAQATRDMVTETDSSGRFTYASAACLDVLGYPPDELVGGEPLRLHHPDDIEAFLAELRIHREVGVPFSVPPHRLRRRDGSWVWVEAVGVWYRRADGEMRIIGAARDLTSRLEAATARRELESQVRQAQKLESLGALTGGIAHDFNNLLTPILGAAGLLLADLPADSLLRDRLETIRQAALRASALTGQMLSYAGGTDLELRPVDLSELVREMLLLLESSVAREARLGFALEPGPTGVQADPGQLGQVIVNLIVNASEALGAAGGRIELATGFVDADRSTLDACVLGDSLEPGRYVTLEVRDDGEGIDEEVLERIFDPFFTTKFTGRGLGLAMVVGIVRAHGGALQVTSTPSAGACFRVLLPAAAGGETAPFRIEEDRGEAPRAWSGSGTLLVIDDDDGAREFVATLLERTGFTVHTASEGHEALRVVDRHAGAICGVILDATMPGLSGEPLRARLRERVPGVPILLVSGYSKDRVAGAGTAADGFLRKPFEPEQLIAAVRTLLGEPEPEPG